MKKFFPAIILTFVLILGVLLRFTPIIAERDLWYDEAFTGILLKEPWGEMNQMIFDDVHPPLYYWMAKPWSSIFNYSPEGIRTFSLIFGVLTIVSVYWIGKKMFETRVGLLAAMIVAISPFAIEYSQEARMYSLFGFFFVWSVWFFYKALDSDNRWDWLGWAIFAGLSFYTHYLALFFFIIFYVCYVLYQRNFKERKWTQAILGHSNFWLGVGTIFAFFASWFRWFFPHMMKGNLGWIDAAQLSDLPKTLQIFFFGHQPGTGGVPSSVEFAPLYKDIPLFDGRSAGLIIFTLLVALFVYAWFKLERRREIFVLSMMSVGTLLFLIILSHFNLKLYVSRYFMPSAVLVYILFAGLLVSVFQKSRWTWIVVMGVYAGVLLLLVPVRYQTGWTQVASFINDKDVFEQDITIVANGPFSYTSARYYFGKDRVKYHNRSNPSEDFSGWVVVGNENRLVELKEIKELEKALVIDWSCDWGAELNLKEMGSFGDLKICAIGE